MIINIKVIPGAKKNLVKEEDRQFKVYLTAPPVDGKANDALVAVLSGHFHVRPKQVRIIKGLKSRHKTIMIDN
ncbi:MAG TPA: DUF167 domain-containing protein [Candidatus Omnitrophota bacterium]|nr:YggU family protein [Candidatus Omnitrophota bacterium]HPB67834.1 DUF167 domain-containing protein [Candidatus Omnitrophota bacterium]HQO58758.1 DUF167 domain-containing protein [Candidatus Omnitrophota bacterium]HQP11995.1 DUF167 domain-containing protein [Candidatus Omnitrophota bacterium]